MAPMELDQSEHTYATLDPTTDFWLYAIDLGTSDTKVFATLVRNDKPDQNPIQVLIDDLDTSPAIIAKSKDSKGQEYFFWGTDLLNKVEKNEVGYEKVLHFVKLCLYSEDKDGCPANAQYTWDRIEAQKLDLRDLLANYLKGIKDATASFLATYGIYAETFDPADLAKLPVHVRLTSPQMLSPGQRAKMQIAAERAGFDAAEIAAEPICAVACYAESIEKRLNIMGISSMSTGTGQFLVVDTGCGTIDIVLFEHTGRINTKAQFRAIRQSSGYEGGSQQVNEYIRARVVADMDKHPQIWKAGVAGEQAAAGIDQAEFDYRLNEEIEHIKVKYAGSNGKDYWININGKGDNRHIIHYKVTEKLIEDAFGEVIGSIVNQIKAIDGHDKARFMFLSGGFGKCPLLRKKLNEEFGNITLSPVGNFTDPLAVAKGALSTRYAAVNCQDLPSTVTYALLRDEPFFPQLHEDARLPSKKGQKKLQADPKKVIREKGRHPLVIDRIKIILKQGERGKPKSRCQTQIFCPLVDNPRISVRLVYFEGDRFQDHDHALVPDHDPNSDAKIPLREGVKEWKTLYATLDPDLLEEHRFTKYYDDDKQLRYHVEAQVVVSYIQQQSLEINLRLRNNNKFKFSVRGELKAWIAKRSDWLIDGETTAEAPSSHEPDQEEDDEDEEGDCTMQTGETRVHVDEDDEEVMDTKADKMDVDEDEDEDDDPVRIPGKKSKRP